MTPNTSLLTTAEVAEACGVDRNTVGRWAKEGRIAAIKLPGGLLRFRREDVERMLTPAILTEVESAESPAVAQ